ncbi:tRNA (guanosine(46)-N7)-methyltransferase TrmB [bacterium]|nr:tRNA (guanosine(46)-N7)-methyltransferase TrmB [bacterium]
MARIRTHTNPFNYFERMKPIDFNEKFPNLKHMDCEIGFGRGIFLREWAKSYPERLMLGIEVRKQIVSVLQERCNKDELDNVWLCNGQGLIFLEDALPKKTLSNVFIFHPDPWFKKRHHNRRVVSHELLAVISERLIEDGLLHISTDVSELWDDILLKIEESKLYEPVENEEFWKKDYSSHWSLFSDRDNRSQFYQSFKLKG